MHHREQTAGRHEGHVGVRKADVSLDTVSLEGTWVVAKSLIRKDHGLSAVGGARGNKTSRPRELTLIPKMLCEMSCEKKPSLAEKKYVSLMLVS